MRMPASCRTRIAPILPAWDGPWSSSARPPRWAAISAGHGADPGRAPPARVWTGRLAGAARRWPDGLVDAGDAANRPGLGAGPRSAGEEPGADHASTCRASPTTSRSGSAPAGPGRAACWSSAAIARRTRRRWPGCAARSRACGSALAWFDAHGDFNDAGHDPVRQRLGDAVRDGSAGAASRTCRRPCDAPTVRDEPMPRCSAARSSTSRSRGCSRPPGGPLRGRACSADPAGLAALRGLGADRRAPDRRLRTSRSTWTPRRRGRLGADDARDRRDLARDRAGGGADRRGDAAGPRVRADGDDDPVRAPAGDIERTTDAVAALAETALG